MTRDEIYEKLNAVFRDIFDDDTITVTDSTTAADIEAWDSLEHVSLMMAIGTEFGIKIPLNKVNSMQNVGEMVDFIAEAVLK
ncbi:MAG: acyl carrier protein [Lachnospiraceae bacterium]|nr:acyl carrier protein [Lachnospiraceae bacterium]